MSLSAPALAVEGLGKTYANGTRAVSDVTLEIEEGDFFGLLGPNGAGKTTIIGVATGLVTKTAGRVRVFGVDIDVAPRAARASIGIVPQEPNFNIFEKVIDIVVNQAGYYGMPRRKALARAETVLADLGLHEKRNDVSATLSGGMKRRLMIARALMHEPRFLILDEPTAGVDVELRRQMWDYLIRLRAGGTTILLTTHYLEEAERLCRNLAIIDKGRIIASGTVRSLLSQLPNELLTLELAEPRAAEAAGALGAFRARVVDEASIEIEIDQERTVSDAVRLLDGAGLAVRSARSQAGRLEEVFVRLIGGGPHA